MTTKVTKWGNSLALRIPRQIAMKHRFHDGASVAFRDTRKGVFIVPVKESRLKKNLPTLGEALANFKSDMVEKVDWGRNVGQEAVKN